MKNSLKAIETLAEAVVTLSEIVREIDPGMVAAYDRIAADLNSVRNHLKHADAFERT